ncbi:MAG: response regulator transcription factor [Candidatus Promineifilaceae bacterium]|jgi:DNA-binding response OmpR family regulator
MIALVVEDDRVLADLIAFTLRREEFQVFLAYDGQAALEQWREQRPNIILLDLNLPKLDGFSVCSRIRAEDDTPIIMLTVRHDEDDIVHGLELGADDYILKPFSPRQLVARIQSVLRRSGKAHAPAVFRAGGLTLDSNRRTLLVEPDESIYLTSLENRLLRYLMMNSGQILTHEDIIGQVWGSEGGDRDMLRQLIRRLRRKIETASDDMVTIENVHGRGYGLIAPDS